MKPANVIPLKANGDTSDKKKSEDLRHAEDARDADLIDARRGEETVDLETALKSLGL
jgi:hypothetical protein